MFSGKLCGPLISVSLLEIRGEKFYAVFLPYLFPDLVQPLRILQRAYRKSRRKKVETACLRLPRRLGKTELKAFRASGAAFRLLL